MKKLSSALVAASLLALSACGGSEQSTANNSVEDVNLATDDLTATDNLGATDPAANGVDPLGDDAGNAANAVDANLSEAGNATENATANATGNSQ